MGIRVPIAIAAVTIYVGVMVMNLTSYVKLFGPILIIGIIAEVGWLLWRVLTAKSNSN